jgi:6-phosphofructokinase 1
MVDGGDNIKKLSWEDVGLIIHRVWNLGLGLGVGVGVGGRRVAGSASLASSLQGGTVIGSARCLQFRERPGRLTAAKNLIERNITNLICSGGDGSLTGANLFRLEWSSLVDELLSTGQITKDQADRCSYLNLVGNVGSIDNDMVYDGELTIGTDTALHRIVEAIDATVSTASSHQRTFVMEVMGRHCGYLAWAAGVACGADWVLIPEAPPEQDDWEGIMCAKLEKRRKRGQRLNIVIVAEGAIDKNGKAITTDYVRQVIVDRLKHDTRATILGHVQRGGQTSAYDRILGTISGAAAVEKVLRAKQGDPATIVGLKGYDIVFAPLVETVKNVCMPASLS